MKVIQHTLSFATQCKSGIVHNLKLVNLKLCTTLKDRILNDCLFEKDLDIFHLFEIYQG